MPPDLTPDRCARLAEALRRAGYTHDGVRALLGVPAHDALGRGEPVPARRASRDGGSLGVLVRLLLLGDVEPGPAVAEALAPLSVEDGVASGLLVGQNAGLRAGLDVRPHAEGATDWWVASDLDAAPGSALADDHVLGVGAASVSLARATVRRPVGTLLDLGTGCGVQALHAARHAGRVTATDVSDRARALAAVTFALNGLDVELLAGPWFEPVAGRRFDQVVSNPPFVVGPPTVTHTYRDSGLAGDAASELVTRGLVDVLAEGGTGQLLAAWLHRRGEDWRERVAAWLPPSGVDAWVVQRDVADPALYVGTWLRDAGVDPASPAGARQAADWLDWFTANHVEAVGFGFVTVRNTGANTSAVMCEDLRHGHDDPLGPEAAAWLDRAAWLRTRNDDALLGARLVVAPAVVLEQHSASDEDGWRTTARWLARTEGPGWRHEVDQLAAAMLGGCRGTLEVGVLLEVLAAGYGEPADALIASALPALRGLIAHGLLLPAGDGE